MAREAEHNLLFGILSYLLTQARREDVLLLSVEDEGGIQAVAVQTPPYNLVLSWLASEGALDVLVQDLAQAATPLPGVLGLKDDARRFCELWGEATGQDYRLNRAQRVFRLERVIPPREVKGRFRPARLDERELLSGWAVAFAREALDEDDTEALWQRSAATVDRFVSSGSLFVWEDGGEPVAIAAASGETPNGRRISLVYTPPDRRGRGYASACVAALSTKILAEGRRFCFLFTDLANPTSNRIYRAIGYAPVCDMDEYRFLR